VSNPLGIEPLFPKRKKRRVKRRKRARVKREKPPVDAARSEATKKGISIARQKGIRIGRPGTPQEKIDAILDLATKPGMSIRKIATLSRTGIATVHRTLAKHPEIPLNLIGQFGHPTTYERKIDCPFI